MAHKCSALVISCIDFRFQTVIRDYLIAANLKDNYDLLSFPGASLAFASIKGAVDVSFRLHQPQTVYLIDHEDCGAYDDDNSLETHKANLDKAKASLKEYYPEAEVKTMMAFFVGVKEI